MIPRWTTCAFNAFAGNSKIFSLQGERMRSYARNDLQVGLGVHAAGAPETLDATIEAADAIAVSLRNGTSDLGPAPDAGFVSLHTGSGLPTGPQVVPMHTTALALDLPEELTDVGWFSTIGSLQLSAGESELVISHPVLVDLDAPLGCPGSEFEPPTSPSGFMPIGPVSEAELESYLDSQSEIVDSGTAELLGDVVPWWEVGEPRSERVNDCGTNQKHLLISFYEGGIVSSPDDPPTTLRIYHLNERLMVIAQGPGDDPLNEFTPVLEHLSIL